MLPLKKQTLFLIFLLAVIFLGTHPSFLQAASSDDLNDQLDDIKAKIKAYQNIIDLKERQGTALTTELARLEAQAATLEKQIQSNQETLSGLEHDVTVLDGRIREKGAIIESQKKILKELLQNDYVEQSALPTEIDLVARSSTLSLFQSSEWLSQTGDRVRELLKSVQDLQKSLVEERATVEKKRSDADTIRIQLAGQKDYLESTQTAKSTLLAKTQSDQAKYNALVDDLEAQRGEIESEIESIESGKVGSLDLKDIPSFKHGRLQYPLKNIVITQGYGNTSFAKKSGFYGKVAFHNGLDFGASTGTTIMAAADGKVIGVGNNGKYAYGKWVAIDHGNGLVTLYGHMSKQSVKKGETVDAGDKIGEVGSTGNATGPHLHFSVFSEKSFDIVPSKSIPSVKDIPVGATVNPKVYLP